MIIRIGSRGSKLALWQAEHIKAEIERLSDAQVEIKIINTKGDKILDSPLSKIGGKGLFTKELEVALDNNEIDLCVHSLKDVPVFMDENFELIAITKRADRRDLFVSAKYKSLEDLPKGAKVGTTSLRRWMEINEIREDLNIESLRGNLQTRLKKLEDGEFDAIILAKAGIDRLNIDSVKYLIPMDENIMIPAMGQAALGIETNRDLDREIKDILLKLNDEISSLETTIERDFVKELGGSCQAPIGINAKVNGDKVEIKYMLGTFVKPRKIIKDIIVISKNEAGGFGKKLAMKLKDESSADTIITQAEKEASEILDGRMANRI